MMNRHSFLRIGLASLSLLATASFIQAEPAAGLPTAQQLMDKYIEATGGKAAYDDVKSVKTEATLSIPQAGLTGSISVLQKMPDKALIVTNISGIGETKVGMIDGVVWALDTLQGPRLIEGKEADAMIGQLDFASQISFDRYKSVNVVGVEPVNGVDTYKVELVNHSDTAETRFYEKESGLLTKTSAAIESPMGKISVDSILSDYAQFGKIKTPTKVTQSMNGMTPETKITSVEYNGEIGDEVFKLPAEIQALLDKKNAAGATPTTQPTAP